MDFTVERYQHELTWLEALAVAAAVGAVAAACQHGRVRR